MPKAGLVKSLGAVEPLFGSQHRQNRSDRIMNDGSSHVGCASAARSRENRGHPG